MKETQDSLGKRKKPPPHAAVNSLADRLRLRLNTCGYARFACSRFGRKYCGQCEYTHITAGCRAVRAALADPARLGWSFSPGGTGFCVRIENIDEYKEYGNDNTSAHQRKPCVVGANP